MAKKTLVFNEEARKGLEAGVNKLADVVKVCLLYTSDAADE